ncbi:MAG TPA: hypothetical protein PLJ60_03945 [Chryseolinea sp.]|nr:hypothetical protein [Chryseolinea sp.]HPH47350.1 hypothetical protein [Chryseolinea sp.]HPM29468.1 hypothetical protein [Chryseolinea sp.]
MKYLPLFLFLLTSCFTQTDKNIIFVRLSPEQFLLEQKEIKKENFQEELKSIIDQKTKNGIKKDELTIDLKVSEQTKRGNLADIEAVLRKLNIRKVTYSTFE